MSSLEGSKSIVQLKIRLLGISPMIWRRVLVPASVTLRDLQVSMGCEGVHNIFFDIHVVHYGSFELSAESPDIPLSRFRFPKDRRFGYLYDMGDYLEHEVRIEQFLDRDPKKTYPVCIGGAPGFLGGQEEAMGHETRSDLDKVIGFVSDILEGRSTGKLTEDDREGIEYALERMVQRQPFLQTTFYRRPVNKAFREGRHLQTMYQQLI